MYIIIDKKQNKKYAVAVTRDGSKECYNEKDDLISYDEIKRNLGI